VVPRVVVKDIVVVAVVVFVVVTVVEAIVLVVTVVFVVIFVVVVTEVVDLATVGFTTATGPELVVLVPIDVFIVVLIVVVVDVVVVGVYAIPVTFEIHSAAIEMAEKKDFVPVPQFPIPPDKIPDSLNSPPSLHKIGPPLSPSHVSINRSFFLLNPTAQISSLFSSKRILVNLSKLLSHFLS